MVSNGLDLIMINVADIDECREGTHLCDHFQNCINTFGAHECRCKSGFELDPSSGSCVGKTFGKNRTSSRVHYKLCFVFSSFLKYLYWKKWPLMTALKYLKKLEDQTEGANGHNITGEVFFLLKINEVIFFVDIDECALKLDNCAPGLSCLNVLGTFTCTRQAVTTSTTPIPAYEYEYYDSE